MDTNLDPAANFWKTARTNAPVNDGGDEERRNAPENEELL
jgi:hypothetical protein